MGTLIINQDRRYKIQKWYSWVHRIQEQMLDNLKFVEIRWTVFMSHRIHKSDLVSKKSKINHINCWWVEFGTSSILQYIYISHFGSLPKLLILKGGGSRIQGWVKLWHFPQLHGKIWKSNREVDFLCSSKVGTNLLQSGALLLLAILWIFMLACSILLE
jgi:hypothetical protein